MMTTFNDLSRAPIKTVQIDTLKINDLENLESRAIMEILLELADENCEVRISESEVRTLLHIYQRMYHSAPFLGLRELIEGDIEIELFFLDLRELVLENDPIQRAEMWKQTYQSFCEWIQHPTRAKAKFGVLSAHAEELLAYAQEVLSLEFQYEIFTQKINYGKKYLN